MWHTVLQIALLVGSGTADARSTNILNSRNIAAGGHMTEWNLAARPFVGHKSLYVAIPAGDLAIYAALRLRHKPHAAAAFAYAEAGGNFACALNNLRQHPQAERTTGLQTFQAISGTVPAPPITGNPPITREK